MVGNEMHRENKLRNSGRLRRVLQSSWGIDEQTEDNVLHAVTAVHKVGGAIYIGRVYDSKIYRIGCNPDDSGFKLVFRNYETRNQFADAFEAACDAMGMSIHRYF
ncbi:MAG: hypothetical protein LBT37_06960 [Lactobacillaceae bacterium]|jgi:hypothetical protein|nr:hypothetical protein [Lactobacillaceae bacterium]